jgi:two-component system LytT family response regulator
MIKAILIDDDANLRTGLKGMLARYAPQIEVVGEAESVATGISTIESSASDVLFLDIQMGDGTGFDILEQLIQRNGKINQQIVFITAFEQYAIKAFRFSALDYLLKPVDPEDLKQVTDKIVQAVIKNSSNENVGILLENIRKKTEEFKRIVLSNSDGTHVFEVNDIIRCESEDNYTKFYIKNHKPILISKTLKEYEELLSPHGFERVHQSHLINMAYVKAFSKTDGFYIQMSDLSKVPVSVRKKDKFQNLIKSI